eukprot:gene9310-9475_t
MPAAKPKAKQHFFKSLDLSSVTKPPEEEDGPFTATKLVASLGPSSHTVPVLEQMLTGGMAAARLDLTWGPLDFHRTTLQSLNTAMVNTRKLCAVVLETLGREILVRRPCVFDEDGWPAHPSPLTITQGQVLTLTTRQDVEASETLLPVTYPHLHNMCQEGDTIYIGRYLSTGSESASLYLNVIKVEDQDIICEATNSAVMDGLMTVFHMERSDDSLLNLQNNLPLLSEYDKEAIQALGTEFEVDFISLAYTRTREDVREARDFLDAIGMTNCRILAKIETRQALLNFRGILATADGVILSRGNLGLDVAPEKICFVQKQLISNCNLLGKPVLINRVVDSMVNNPRPTRAEATDIANAVLDGVDGILLGAETLRGIFPVEVVSTIAQICRVAEGVFDYTTHYDHLMSAAQEMDSIVKAAAQQAAYAKIHHDVEANGHSPLAMGNKAVAFAPGSGSDQEDDLPDGNSVDGSDADLQTLAQTAAAMGSSGSFGNLQAAYQEVHAFAKYGGAGSKSVYSMPTKSSSSSMYNHLSLAEQMPILSKLESLASSAVRTAGNIGADLIVVYTATGRTAQLVAKYRPPMAILTLVVPRLVNDGIKWRLEGRSTARACQLTRGLLPMLATPGPNGDAVLETAVVASARSGLVGARGHVVVLQQIHDDFCVKVMSLDKTGTHIVRSKDPTFKSRAAAKSGRVVGALYPKTPGVPPTSSKINQGSMIEEDIMEEDCDDEDEFDVEDPPLLAGGSFLVSASATYPAAVSEMVVPGSGCGRRVS